MSSGLSSSGQTRLKPLRGMARPAVLLGHSPPPTSSHPLPPARAHTQTRSHPPTTHTQTNSLTISIPLKLTNALWPKPVQHNLSTLYSDFSVALLGWEGESATPRRVSRSTGVQNVTGGGMSTGTRALVKRVWRRVWFHFKGWLSWRMVVSLSLHLKLVDCQNFLVKSLFLFFLFFENKVIPYILLD